MGKMARLAEGANWVFHLLSHLYSSIAYALAENKRLSWEIAAMLAKVVVVGVRRIVARGAQDLTNYAIL